MSATSKVNISKLGIIAGGGDLPCRLIDRCFELGIEPYLVGFKGQTPAETMRSDLKHVWVGLGCAGKIIEFFKSNNVSDLVMIGGVRRPSLSEIKPDFRGVQILSRIGFRALGDHGLLDALKKELENDGFSLHGFYDFCEQFIMPEGDLASVSPLSEDNESIALGLDASQGIGALDIGQSVIVQQGLVIGVEGVEGTDALIERCSPLLKKGRGGILVKTCKPQQDERLDMPVIGRKTVIQAAQYGLIGLVFQAGKTIIVDPKTVAKCADQYKIFVHGVSV